MRKTSAGRPCTGENQCGMPNDPNQNYLKYDAISGIESKPRPDSL